MFQTEGETVTFPLHFPNRADGITLVTIKELQHLIANDEVTIKSNRIRSLTMQTIADAYKDENQIYIKGDNTDA